MSYRKVFRYEFIAICNHCNYSFSLTKDLIAEQEKKQMDGKIPLSASKASGTVFCPNCNGTDFKINFEYSNPYRRRCIKCGEMFETLNSWQEKCNDCMRKHVELIASMGPG